MKKLIFLFVLLFIASFAFAENKDAGFCPKTKMKEDCLKCHTVPNFKLIESKPDETNVYPIQEMKVLNGKGYLYLKFIEDDTVKKFFDYLDMKGIKYAIIEIHCPGGGLFAATRIVNLMHHWESKGGIIETRVYGFALSGGFMVFIAGTKGHRFVSPYADLMWHEIISIEMFAIKFSTPSDKEEEARVLRHLQDVRNSWIASRGKLSKQELDEKIKKKEFWMTGEEAIKFGFADGLIKD
ncbi:MAG: ATP-dependent Clp protease proteolytic subunit [candidate division WOR-3 bacterium]